MAKESGIGFTVALDASDSAADTITNDITNLQFGTPRNIQDVTGLDKLGHERLQLLLDFTATLNGIFNDALSHITLKDICSTSVTRLLTLSISGQSLAPEVKVNDYALTRAADGGLSWSAPCNQADGATLAWS